MTLDRRLRSWWPALLLAAPLVVMAHSIFTWREMREMRGVYLRTRAAAVAARLETLADLRDAASGMAAEEPWLSGLRILPPDSHEGPRELWEGRELYRTEPVRSGGRDALRAWIPFHSGGRMHLARIDIDVAAADFVLDHAGHGLAMGAISSLALLVLSGYAWWSAKRRAELRELARLGQLSATLAHEIRNPLGALKGFTQLARERADSGTGAFLDPALREIGRLEKLVSDLLLYGRPRMPARRTAEWGPLAGELAADPALRFADAVAPMRMETDPDLLRQVLLNLLRNARDAAPEGEVRIEGGPLNGRGFELTVIDDGPGIAPDVREKLFEPFATNKASGTGLGLSIARKLTRSLGGELTLESPPGGGVRARLRFPHAAAAPMESQTWKASSS